MTKKKNEIKANDKLTIQIIRIGKDEIGNYRQFL